MFRSQKKYFSFICLEHIHHLKTHFWKHIIFYLQRKIDCVSYNIDTKSILSAFTCPSIYHLNLEKIIPMKQNGIPSSKPPGFISYQYLCPLGMKHISLGSFFLLRSFMIIMFLQNIRLIVITLSRIQKIHNYKKHWESKCIFVPFQF